jgi:hypothetical protein
MSDLPYDGVSGAKDRRSRAVCKPDLVKGTVISQFMLDGRMAASIHAGVAATLKVATAYQE